MNDESQQLPKPTAEDLERALVALLAADRRRIYREYLAQKEASNDAQEM